MNCKELQKRALRSFQPKYAIFQLLVFRVKVFSRIISHYLKTNCVLEDWSNAHVVAACRNILLRMTSFTRLGNNVVISCVEILGSLS